MLGLTLLEKGTAWKTPKAEDAALCPPLEDNSVRVDIRILSQNQGILVSHDFQNRSTYHQALDAHRSFGLRCQKGWEPLLLRHFGVLNSVN